MPRHIHIVKVHHLTLSFPTRKDPNPKPVLDDVDFGIRDGEILGLIGNSGSGKTMTSLAIAGLLPENAEITSGSIKFAGEDLLGMNPKERRAMLGKDIGMIFQEPSTALDPLMTCGKQLEEVLTAHKENTKTPEERHKTIIDMLETRRLYKCRGDLRTLSPPALRAVSARGSSSRAQRSLSRAFSSVTSLLHHLIR